jgi:hypothetical protein
MLTGLVPGAAAQTNATIINHVNGSTATNAPLTIMKKIGLLRWFFTHASVGGNITTGLNVLHESDTNRYLFRIHNYDGDNSDWAYHGGVATAGSAGSPSYRAAASPASTSNGVVYECMRGNPDWSNKIACFSNSVVTSGWRFPKVNVVMDKFCWIDPYANPTNYCATMNSLEGRYPETLFVYMTIPLSGLSHDQNDERNAFNRYVRDYCAANNRYLLDAADLEAWDTNGVQQTYVSGGVTNQKMSFHYSLDTGGDWHLNATGRRRIALAWYSLAAALFAIDRDHDGTCDGDELIAGTQPANPASRFMITGLSVSNAAAVSLACTTARIYRLEWRPDLAVGDWQAVAGQGSVTGGGGGILTLSDTNLPVDGAFYRVTVDAP